jgi:hypothetical protein
MKNIFLFLFLLSVTVYAQESVSLVNSDFTTSASGGVWTKKSSKPSLVKGSSYLFDKWNNKSKIYSIDNRTQVVTYLNYNLRTGNFESKLINVSGIITSFSSDSVFVFDSNSIKKVVLNNKHLVKVNNPESSKNEFMEFISKTSSFDLYKLSYLSVVEGKLNPLTQEAMSDDKYVINSKYFIQEDNKVFVFKLRKGTLLKKFGKQKKIVNDFILSNNLNIKNDLHLKRIFTYYNSL